jgi:hypothetical protein
MKVMVVAANKMFMVGFTLSSLISCSVEAAIAREEISFSNGWRFLLGFGLDDEGPGPGKNWLSTFIQTTGPCDGMFPDPHRMSFTDCGLACAYQQNCSAWYQHGRSCAVAYGPTNCTPAVNNASANGGFRSIITPLQTNYKYAADSLPEANTWKIIDAPHDALMDISNIFSESGGDPNHGYRVRNVTWYRKQFSIPSDWVASEGGAIYLRFEGVMHIAQFWLNGVYLGMHSATYNEFTVRLDNVTSLRYDSSNVIAVRADASFGSEHWYGGGGLIRSVKILRVPSINIVENGLFVPSELQSGGRLASFSAELQNFETESAQISVRFDIIDNIDLGKVLASVESPKIDVPSQNPNMPVSATASSSLILPPTVSLWSIKSPSLYTVVATILQAGVAMDTVNITSGWRTTKWDPNFGFYLNDESIKHRGFSHHNSFGGVGVAMPPRLDVFRVSASRALGANIHRMSHNPYRRSLYDVLDRLGVLVWNENRDFGPAYTFQMGEMAKRDRNHASIIVNSLGNEIELVNLPFVGTEMVAESKKFDPSRPTTANTAEADGLFSIIDIQGLSHATNATFETFRTSRPNQPLVLSECCSCTSQRFPRAPSGDACIVKENSPGIDNQYVSGSLGVWTLIDYFGEPPGPWPFVSSSFGQFDLAGMPKPNAYVYSTMWRERVNADPSRPPVVSRPIARITTLLDQIPNFSISIHGIVSSSFAELFVDGVSQGVLESFGVSLIWNVSSVSKNATLNAVDKLSGGNILASHSVFKPQANIAALKSVLDVPSISTGTGSALYLDGEDIALIRISTVDSAGNLISIVPVNITFSILSGPGRIAGVSSGNPAAHDEPNGATVLSFGGLARGFVQVNLDCTSPYRDRMLTIDVDGRMRTKVLPPTSPCPSEPIVVLASTAEGFNTTISIPVSGDPNDSPLESASRGFSAAAIDYLEKFVG